MFQSETAAGGATGVLDAPATAPAPAPELWFQRCRWCHNVTFQRLLCPTCASPDLEPQLSGGAGVVARSTVLHRNTSSARNLSLIDMAEGFSVQCTVNGCAPDKVQPGARVRLSATADQTGPELVFELCDSPLRDRRY